LGPFQERKKKMEIDKAIGESDDKRLKTKYNNAIFVIKRALALYSIEEVAFSFNGGKDSTVSYNSSLPKVSFLDVFFFSPHCFLSNNNDS
jgi:3'-phosphoadenosine 5'-phosphosulfate sulfotransferase (PAPS reductase)/FAD synthetase